MKIKDGNGSMILRFELLVSALKVHGYNFRDLTILADDALSHGVRTISLESREILKSLAEIATKALKTYIEKLSVQDRESIRAKHIDLFSIVLIAFFDDIMVQVNCNPVIEVSKFFEKLNSLKLVPSCKVLPDLSSYLSAKS